MAQLILDKADPCAAPVVRRSLLADRHYPLHHRAPPQEFHDQTQHPFVPDHTTDPAHQDVVIDMVEELCDIVALGRFLRLYLSPDK